MTGLDESCKRKSSNRTASVLSRAPGRMEFRLLRWGILEEEQIWCLCVKVSNLDKSGLRCPLDTQVGLSNMQLDMWQVSL